MLRCFLQRSSPRLSVVTRSKPSIPFGGTRSFISRAPCSTNLGTFSSLCHRTSSAFSLGTQHVQNTFLTWHHNIPSPLYQTSTPEKESNNDKEHKESGNDQGETEGRENPWSPENRPPPPPGTSQTILAFGALTLAVSGYALYTAITHEGKAFNWQDLKEEIINENVAKIYISNNGQKAVVGLHEGGVRNLSISSEKRFTQKLEGLQMDIGKGSVDFIPILHRPEGFLSSLFAVMIPLVGFGILLLVLNSRTGAGGMEGMGKNMFSQGGKSKHKLATLKDLKTRFADVAGLDEAKEEVMEFVSFLKDPKKYKAIGAKVPKGALLVGPPGTGKTLLAKAIAAEAGVPFFSISGSDFVEMYVGVGPASVRKLFKDAREKSPCIIWIDEIDAIGKQRSGQGDDERENTLNQLLVEMDGFDERTNIIVFAGTNRANVLDSALLRPGRFDRQISIDAPDIVGRKDIFKVHLKKVLLAEDEKSYSKRLAALTPAMTGAEIANVCNEGALIAARADKDFVEFSDFEAAIERVIAGMERKSRVLSKEEKTRVAYHEAGHAIAGWFLEHAYPLLKVSIVPRGIGTLGYAQYQPKDQNLFSTEQFEHKLCTLLAGRAAEQLKFNNISSGAMDDLEKVTQIVYGQIVSYGMNSSIGNISFPNESGHTKKFYSEDTAQMIDSEAHKMVMGAYDRTLVLLKEKFDLIELVAQHLLKHEVLRKDEMEKLVGPRPFAEVTTYDEMARGE